MDSLLTAVLDLAGEDFVKERVKDNIPKMNLQKKKNKVRKTQKATKKVSKTKDDF